MLIPGTVSNVLILFASFARYANSCSSKLVPSILSYNLSHASIKSLSCIFLKASPTAPAAAINGPSVTKVPFADTVTILKLAANPPLAFIIVPIDFTKTNPCMLIFI